MTKKINWDKVKDVIGAVAPTVGAALGGPFGAIAGKAIHGHSIAAAALSTPTSPISTAIPRASRPPRATQLVGYQASA